MFPNELNGTACVPLSVKLLFERTKFHPHSQGNVSRIKHLTASCIFLGDFWAPQCWSIPIGTTTTTTTTTTTITITLEIISLYRPCIFCVLTYTKRLVNNTNPGLTWKWPRLRVLSWGAAAQKLEGAMCFLKHSHHETPNKLGWVIHDVSVTSTIFETHFWRCECYHFWNTFLKQK